MNKMSRRYLLDAPEGFSLRHSIESHGWYDLLPFRYNENSGALTYTFIAARGGEPSTIEISAGGETGIEVLTDGIGKAETNRVLARLFRFDEPLDEFYGLIEGRPGLEWAGVVGAGRLLRSATVYEDLVKTICTTNCSWGLTKKMVTNLVELLGEKSPSGERAFPTPAAMAAAGVGFYKDEVRAGYRSLYLLELAEAVAAGVLEPESWLRADVPTNELRGEIKKVKGIGDYAADHLLKLLGRYEGLALDSWLRSGFYKKHNKGKTCPDSKIERHYKNFGRWKGLAIWCDMTESWFGER